MCQRVRPISPKSAAASKLAPRLVSLALRFRDVGRTVPWQKLQNPAVHISGEWAEGHVEADSHRSQCKRQNDENLNLCVAGRIITHVHESYGNQPTNYQISPL